MAPVIRSAPDIFWVIFLPFNSLKNENFKKMEKCLEISSFYTSVPKIMIICHTVSMVCDGCNCYFLFWAIFLPFYPNNSPKNENFKKMKKILAISSFYKIVPKITMMCYTGPEIWHMTNKIIFHFGLFLHFYPHNSTKNETLKKKKNTWRYHHFTQLYQKL